MNIEDILALDDNHRVVVKIPEWKTEITVVSMTAAERADIERRWNKRDATSDPAAFRADILEKSLKHANGAPFGTPEQIRQLLAKNACAIERLFEAACKVSGFSKQDVEDIAKN